MYIRQTRTNNKATGEGYFTCRLVRGERVGGKVRQITVLNLRRNFPVKQEDWPLLCSRIEHLLHPQERLLAVECPEHIERVAQRYAGQLVARAPARDNGAADAVPPASGSPSTSHPSPDFQEIDTGSLQLAQPRSVGVEHVGLHAVAQLGLTRSWSNWASMASSAPPFSATLSGEWPGRPPNEPPGTGCKSKAPWAN